MLAEKKRTYNAQMNSVIRALKLLEILKNYTDSNHKLTQSEVLNLMKELDGCCTEKTLRTDLRNLIAALNPIVEGLTWNLRKTGKRSPGWPSPATRKG